MTRRGKSATAGRTSTRRGPWQKGPDGIAHGKEAVRWLLDHPVEGRGVTFYLNLDPDVNEAAYHPYWLVVVPMHHANFQHHYRANLNGVTQYIEVRRRQGACRAHRLCASCKCSDVAEAGGNCH